MPSKATRPKRNCTRPGKATGFAVIIVIIVSGLAFLGTSVGSPGFWPLPAAAVMAIAAFLLGMQVVRRRESLACQERSVLAGTISRLRVANDRLENKNAQLEATLSGMMDGVAVLDADLHLVTWNARFPDIAGVPEHVLRPGQTMEEILRAQARTGQFGPIDIEAEVARRLAALRAGGSVGVAERTKPDGRVVELRRNRLPDGSFVTLYNDITQRKQAEAALIQARAAAEEATRAKSRFVAIVSHEIRTPLNALLNTLRLLHEGRLSQPQQRLLGIASQAGEALIALSNDILELSRMEAGQLALRASAFELRPLTEGATSLFAAQAQQRGVELRIDTAADCPATFFADPGRLRQILINLLSNAVKFARPGEVILAVERDREQSSFVRFAVRDHGPVIPSRDQERLFRPFSRLGETSSDSAGGSGLGLAICRQLAALMGGRIGYSTHRFDTGETGNEFWLTLPDRAGPATEQCTGAPTGDSLPVRLPRTRILLVEDIHTNQVITSTLLRRDGHHVEVACNAEQALAAIESTPYDIVLTDIHMPGMSGTDMTRLIRRLGPPGCGLPIFALSGSTSADMTAACTEAGMNGLLGKPVVLTELRAAIARTVWGTHSATGIHGHSRPRTVRPATLLNESRVRELKSGLPPATLVSAAAECATELQQRLGALRIALAAANADDARFQIHAMTGVAGSYGLAALEQRLRQIMAAIRGGDLQAATQTAAHLGSELQEGLDALQRTLQSGFSKS